MSRNVFDSIKNSVCGIFIIFILAILAIGCYVYPQEEAGTSESIPLPEYHYDNTPDYGGAAKYKIPLSSGYNWEITQSWGNHCTFCNNKGYSVYEGNFCSLTHTSSCCLYGWDFNLPGNDDSGKSVLATGDGTVKDIGESSWGVFVVVDHGNNICSRYAHLLPGSVRVSEGQQVCQGLKLAEIGNSGNSSGYHLHFQFEQCSMETPIAMGFDDGNNIPVCTIGLDVFDEGGNYIALRLTNEVKSSCGNSSSFSGGEMDETGWISSSCGDLPDCPLMPNCGREGHHTFTDNNSMDSVTREASSYLYSECALDGKADGGFHPNDKLSRAEALKVPMYLFGLMEGCGANSEPFLDVNQNDWFFSVVACGIRKGIVANTSTYFSPNSNVTFAEAAKVIALSASNAGVIDLQNPATGHFSGIPSNHWAYRYAETLYYYGGIPDSLLSISPNATLKRKDYVLMVASLSPCFCKNVLCEGGCVCNQETFSCSDPADESFGSGGRNGQEANDDEENGPSVGNLNSGTFGISCWVDPQNSRCDGQSPILYIECGIQNNSGDELRLNNLTLSLTDQADRRLCSITKANLQEGVGTQHVSPHQYKELTGHFEVTCYDLPADRRLQTSLALTERISGDRHTYNNFFLPVIYTPDPVFIYCEQVNCVPQCRGKECGPDYCGGFCGYCANGSSCNYDAGRCVQNQQQAGQQQNPPANAAAGWQCNPAAGYLLTLASPGAVFQIQTSGPNAALYRFNMPAQGQTGIQFECNELPAALLVAGGQRGVSLARADRSLPMFYFYLPYNENIALISPAQAPTGVVESYSSPAQFLRIMFLIPAR